MSRVSTVLVALLIATAPVAGVVVQANGPGGNPCCSESVIDCTDPVPRLRCCGGDAPPEPASQPAPLTSAPAGRDVPAAEIAAPATAAPLVAAVASRAFVARQGLVIHAPPQLWLCTLLI